MPDASACVKVKTMISNADYSKQAFFIWKIDATNKNFPYTHVYHTVLTAKTKGGN